MCSSPRAPKPPRLPPERAIMRQPNRFNVRAEAGTRAMDRMRTNQTILTSGRGVLEPGEMERKTLLGQ